MKNDLARTISTAAIWGSVTMVLVSIKINGPPDMIVATFVGMTAFLSIGAAVSTYSIWRQASPSEPKVGQPEV